MSGLRRILAVFGMLFTASLAFGQLAGSYDIGGATPEYATFSAAVADLYTLGISDAVTFNVYGGDYNEQVKLLGPIPGATADDTVKFFDASGTARLRVTALLPSAEGVIHDSLASYVIFDGIDIWLNHVNDSTYKCLVIKGASNCVFRNAEWRGAGYTASTVKYGVYMWSTASTNNVFDNIRFVRHNNAIRISGGTAQRHANNIIRNCTIDSCWTGIYAAYTPGLRVYDNDIRLNGAGGSGVYGVEINTQVAADTVFIYRNLFHNMTTAGNSSYIRNNPTNASIANIFNNFFYDVFVTGTAAPYIALYASGGTSNFDFNSVYINDVTSSGILRGIYKSSSSAVVNIRNNIFVSAETSNSTYIYAGLSAGYDPAILDYNAYYNAGANASYQVFRTSSTGYANLAALQAATAFEDHGVEGDPGFTSATDLHIQNTYGLVSNIGIPVDGVTDDIDGDPRSATPDLGADEYAFLAPANDYAVTEFYDVTYLTTEFTLTHPRARVSNRGSASQTDVPVVLFWDDVPQDTVLVSLAPEAVEIVTFDWTTPASQDTGVLKAKSFLAGDVDLSNDSVFTTVVIIGFPMHGTYDIGGGANHYPNFSTAVSALTLRGIDAAVIFEAYNGTYNDTLYLGAIAGVSAANTITFRENLGQTAVITYNSGGAVVKLVGADYTTIDGIDITATDACSRGVQIYSDADYNTIKNSVITGSSVSATTTYGVHVQSGGNDYNTFENLTVSGAYYGIRLAGATGAADVGNEVKYCVVLEGKYGLYSDYQRGGRLHDCDVQPGWTTAATEVYGLYASSQTAGDTVFFYNNRIHNIRTSGTSASNGIYTVGSATRIYNNFVWDFQATGTGPVYGIRVYGGNPEIYFNSVLIGDVATTGGTSASTGHINGFFMQTASSNATLKNNIFQIDEPTDTCYAINRYQGTLTSDNNCVYSSGGARYLMGRDGTGFYPNLAAWQVGLGRDLNSLDSNPGYVSGTDLHIQETVQVVDGAAVPIDGIAMDIDGDARDVTPDIGADEYDFLSIAHDYAVNRFIDMPGQYQSGIPQTTLAEVQNNGSTAETDVPVVLYYNNTPLDTVLMSLVAAETDTAVFNWSLTGINYQVGELKAKAFCPNDGYPANDSTTAPVIIYGGPMGGIYDIGGGDMDYATFGDAIQSVYIRGVFEEVIFDVYAGTYNENVILTNPIPGASFLDRVTFRAHPSPVRDVVTVTSNASTPVVIDSCDYVTFDGIDVTCTGNANVGYYVDDDADYVTIRNSVITCRDSTETAVRGIVVTRDRCDYVTIDNCTITGALYGIMTFDGGSSNESSFLEIKNCTVRGANYCIFLDNTPSARCHHNDLKPGTSESYDAQGVLVESQTAGDSVFVYNNVIHDLNRTNRSSTTDLSGIYARPGTGNGETYIFNNMIYGLDITDPRLKGPVNGIFCGAGTIHIYHNSIFFGDIAHDSLGPVSGVKMESASSNVLMYNNVIKIAHHDTAYAVYQVAANNLLANWNCYYGTGALYNTGNSVGSVYATLFDWQVTGYDGNSVSGEPGFLSATDLHIDPMVTLVDNVGLYLDEVSTDFDGEARNNPPDMGADEYVGLHTPDAVDSLTVIYLPDTGAAVLRWTASAYANSYKIYVGSVYDFEVGPATYLAETTALTYTHANVLSTGTPKFYVVIASTDIPARR